MLLLLLSACKHERPPDTPAADAWEAPFTWTLAEPAACPAEVPADDPTEELLNALGLDLTVGIPKTVYQQYGGNIKDDPARLSHFHDLQQDLTSIPCFAGNRALRADAAVASEHPLATFIADAATELDLTLTVGGPLPSPAAEDPLAAAVTALGGDPADTSAIPPALAEAAARVLLVAGEAADARDAAFDALSDQGPGRVFNYGPYTWLQGNGGLEPDDEDTTGLFTAGLDGWVTLYAAGVRLGQVLDETDWPDLAGGSFTYYADTPLGAVVLRGSEDDVWDPVELEEPILLAIDTGGNDTWRVSAGGTADADHPVAIALDLGGDDTYAYVEEPDADDVEGLLPSDADGRATSGEAIGAYSQSTVARQGAGVAGYGFLLDLGGGADTYRSLRESQGFASFGVGVLWDDGGNDTYTAEAGAQGAAIVGIALQYDGGGDDVWRSYIDAQGFGWVLSNATLYDAGGNDRYEMVVDDVLVYYSPQVPGVGNASLGQGTAFGWRRDDTNTHLAGGLALLRDRSGNDTYEGSTFVQGTGYWMGMGALADAEGDDEYDGLFYAQGAATHFALGAFLEGGGDDRYDANLELRSSSIGLAHDYSVVVMVEGGGNDTYEGVDRSIGAGKCHGLGLLLELGGDDSYTSNHVRSIGWATDYDWAVDTCGTDNDIPTYGLFVDADGTDTYDKPEADAYGDGKLWISDDTLDTEALEYGGGIDGIGRVTFASAYAP